ncbi:hypothetical protein [Formosa algae]|uniref:Uncharacterized protein n=1 Tax=Formosa algae TaxID=225843 RepID=A0A9X0YJ46_9FLAO|nr:hypothetical protein [Formosa algae]MBP1839484.1 hypothetical protein [Formosa algae]MDQ0334788.1 hypothetical protein [Formosa algae]
MKPTVLLGAASAMMKSKKLKFVFAALQLGYLAYTLFGKKSKEPQQAELAE